MLQWETQTNHLRKVNWCKLFCWLKSFKYLAKCAFWHVNMFYKASVNSKANKKYTHDDKNPQFLDISLTSINQTTCFANNIRNNVVWFVIKLNKHEKRVITWKNWTEKIWTMKKVLKRRSRHGKNEVTIRNNLIMVKLYCITVIKYLITVKHYFKTT